MRILLSLLLFCTISCSAESNKQETTQEQTSFKVSDISTLYGDWKVFKVQEYRGGVTEKEEAEGYIGKTISIKKGIFSFMGIDLKNPKYIFKEINNIVKEGVVPSEKTSSFYGYKTDRKTVNQYDIMSKTGKFTYFEVIEKNLLLFPYDGWFIFVKK
jgi:hypothetical protein